MAYRYVVISVSESRVKYFSFIDFFYSLKTISHKAVFKRIIRSNVVIIVV